MDTDITSISLQINTNKYYNYTLIRIQDDQEIIVREIDGSTRTEIIHDTNLSPNTTYQYYIKYSQKGSTKPQISKVISAVTKSIKQPNEYNIIDYEWLFS